MSSRGGPRASGTDGSDFSHRERVASHYKESVRQKIKVKVCIWIHLLFVVCAITWYGLAFTRNVELAPDPWIMAWCASCFPALIGLQALPKNRSNVLYVFSLGVVVMGIGPLMYGSTFTILDVLNNMSDGIVPGTQDWRILPIKMAIIAFVIQLHAITVFYSSKLISAWKAKGEKGS